MVGEDRQAKATDRRMANKAVRVARDVMIGCTVKINWTRRSLFALLKRNIALLVILDHCFEDSQSPIRIQFKSRPLIDAIDT